MSKNDELVFGVPTMAFSPISEMNVVFSFSHPRGNEVAEMVHETLAQTGHYMKRGECETNEEFKQIIPQIALIAEGKILVHDIPSTAGEERLHHKSAIFVGGHMNPDDKGDPLVAAMREFGEEVGYEFTVVPNFFGVINLDDSPVNRVHIGLIYVFTGPRAIVPPIPKDDGVSNPRFMFWGDVAAMIDKLTPWSRAAFQMLREYHDPQFIAIRKDG